MQRVCITQPVSLPSRSLPSGHFSKGSWPLKHEPPQGWEEPTLREAVVMGGFLKDADLTVDLAEEGEFQGGGCCELMAGTLFRNEGLTLSTVGCAI